ncbi:DUF4352 domain-containing protein [Virgibacillus soli]|uniref:DUF4352 domain-containing protein n=1 Tax=Paracerasibacillus soli TaxID=480284 RepID=UPI0035E6D70D
MIKRMSVAILLIMGLFLTACSGNDDGDKKEEPNNEQGASTSNKEKSNDKNESKEGNIYQIGETAKTETSSLGYPYEVTVNSYEVTTDDIEGKSLENYNLDPENRDRFVVVNVTLKNIGEKSFIPNEQLAADLVFTNGGYEHDLDFDFFLERNNELSPGNDITGNLVYTSTITKLQDQTSLHLVFEHYADEEIRFELPVPKE